MPKITMGLDARNRLVRALTVYTSELAEIIDAIGIQVRLVGAKEEDYVPKILSDEQQLARDAMRIVRGRPGEDLQFFGVNLWDDHLRTIASALLLHKDDLIDRLRSVKSNLLMPPEASFPIEFELTNLERDFEGFYSQYGQSDLLGELRSRRELKAGLAYPRNLDFAELIPEGEGQTLEFKGQFPEQADDLAKEMAAFGTTNPGVILLGISDTGDILGMDSIGTTKGFDKLRTRVEGISSNGINPSLAVRVRLIQIDEKNIAVVEVPKGAEPVYYTRIGVPYIRHGSMSRPALPQEVNELVKRHLERR